MIKPESPCIFCTARTERCHSNCEIYTAYRNNLEEYRNIVRENRQKGKEQVIYSDARRKRIKG